MVRSNSRVFLLVVVTFSFHVEHKQAANTGGSDHSNLLIVTKHPPTESTTLRPPLTTPGLFASSGPNNYTVQAGTKVTLHCQVDYLAENTSVSWLRRFGDSLTLVSVGTEVYSGDKRYTSAFSGRKDWQLNINGVNQTDQGYYECQLSSHPPIVRSIYLHVLVPVLEIADERSLPIKNKFYNSGSTIELKCVITKVPTPTQFIIWTHNSTVLNYDTTRGGISVKTDILPDGAKSQLYINNVGPADSGNYTCSLGEAAVTSVSVVVITGETPAAMQHGRATSQVSAAALSMTAALLIRYVS